MTGTLKGGLKAAETNRQKYGKQFYARIGAMGGAKSKTGGFACEEAGPDGLTGRERASIAGAIGGRKRRYKKVEIGSENQG